LTSFYPVKSLFGLIFLGGINTDIHPRRYAPVFRMILRRAGYRHGNSGGAKVGPAGARAPAVKTCAPAVPRQLAGSWAKRQQQPVDTDSLTSKK